MTNQQGKNNTKDPKKHMNFSFFPFSSLFFILEDLKTLILEVSPSFHDQRTHMTNVTMQPSDQLDGKD
jgi:hypothetical protein